MQIEVQRNLFNDKQMAEFLKQNSEWFKHLNRDPELYKNFVSLMKEKYKVRATDKVEKFMENVDLINSVMGVLR